MKTRRVFIVYTMASKSVIELGCQPFATTQAFSENLAEFYDIGKENSWIIYERDARAQAMAIIVSSALGGAPVDRETSMWRRGGATVEQTLEWLDRFIQNRENIILISDIRLIDLPAGEIVDRECTDWDREKYHLKLCYINPEEFVRDDAAANLSKVMSKMHFTPERGLLPHRAALA